MTGTLKHVARGGLLTAALSIAAATLYANAQDVNTSQTPPPFIGQGGSGAPGGPFRQGGWSGGPAMGPGGPLGMLRMLGEQLQLTDAQREQIKAIVQSHRDEWQTLTDRARAAHQALAAAVTADAVDETAIRAKSADVAAIEADMAVAGAHSYAEVLQILTADQKTKLKTLQAQLSARRPSARGRR